MPRTILLSQIQKKDLSAMQIEMLQALFGNDVVFEQTDRSTADLSWTPDRLMLFRPKLEGPLFNLGNYLNSRLFRLDQALILQNGITHTVLFPVERLS